jgi:PilZ domain
MGEKRKSRRLPFRKRIRLGKGEPTFMGYASNISDGGLEIESRNIYPPGTRLVISFQDENDTQINSPEIRIMGIVRWSTRLIGSLSGNMGIEITADSQNAVKRIYSHRINKLIKD